MGRARTQGSKGEQGLIGKQHRRKQRQSKPEKRIARKKKGSPRSSNSADNDEVKVKGDKGKKTYRKGGEKKEENGSTTTGVPGHGEETKSRLGSTSQGWYRPGRSKNTGARARGTPEAIAGASSVRIGEAVQDLERSWKKVYQYPSVAGRSGNRGET